MNKPNEASAELYWRIYDGNNAVATRAHTEDNFHALIRNINRVIRRAGVATMSLLDGLSGLEVWAERYNQPIK